MNDTISNVVAQYGSRELQHVRRTLEVEALAAVEAGETMTQAHVGRLDMLAAVGAELDRRGHLAPLPEFVDLCHENGIRFSVTVRVW